MEHHSQLAFRYAKALIDLAVEKSILDIVYEDILYLEAICNASKEFVDMLKNPLIPHEKKSLAINAVTEGKINELTTKFTELLTHKKREKYLLLVIESFKQQYCQRKGIQKVKLLTAIPVNENIKNVFREKIKSQTALQQFELECEVNKDLIGGFILEYDGKQLDASLKSGLRKMDKHFAAKDNYKGQRFMSFTKIEQVS